MQENVIQLVTLHQTKQDNLLQLLMTQQTPPHHEPHCVLLSLTPHTSHLTPPLHICLADCVRTSKHTQ